MSLTDHWRRRVNASAMAAEIEQLQWHYHRLACVFVVGNPEYVERLRLRVDSWNAEHRADRPWPLPECICVGEGIISADEGTVVAQVVCSDFGLYKFRLDGSPWNPDQFASRGNLIRVVKMEELSMPLDENIP